MECVFADVVGYVFFFFFQAEDGIRDGHVTGVQTCALPISQAVNRSEQSGPALIGQRADGKNLDLNRDYFKAEAPETRASLARVYTTWDPALMVDLHTTDGTLHGYQLTYAPPLDPNGPAGPSTFVRDRMLPALRKTLQDKYHESTFDYGNVEAPQAPQRRDTYAPRGR